MKKISSIVIVLVAAAILLAGSWYLLKKSIRKEQGNLVGNNMEITEEAKSKYEGAELGLSNSSEKINLKAVSGNGASAMATRELAGETFLHTIAAELTEPRSGFYAGWLIRESDNETIYTGKLELKKGGWILEYVGRKDLSEYKLVVVSLEKVDDQRIEQKTLEGRFK